MRKKAKIDLQSPLPEYLARGLRASARAHTARIRAQQLLLGAYPDPATVTKFDDDISEGPIHFVFKQPGEYSFHGGKHKGKHKGKNRHRRQRRHRGHRHDGKRNDQKGKSSKSTKSSQGRRPLPNPAVVHEHVARMMASMPVAGMTGNVQILELNCEFLDRSKAVYFQDSYVEVMTRGHIIFLEEVEAEGVAYLGEVLGYQAFCSEGNNRKQAVGFLIHPRFKVVGGPTTYKSIANVQGVPDLRPAYRLDLVDTVSGVSFSVVVLHLKSMMGGVVATTIIRYRQFVLVVEELGPDFVGVVGGDLNYKINNPSSRDGEPMINAGYVLVGKNDHSATQIMGSRIDGLFIKGMPVGVDYYRVVAFFNNPNLGRTFTDHAVLGFELLTASTDSNAWSGSHRTLTPQTVSIMSTG